ncbi:MAG: ATP-binding protein, partial [Bacteroidaceae bacterium]|nr:ATP-binding protein [Bacteroidaceae bacterium]
MSKEYKNPWLGLQSYQEGEILYGRDEDINALSQCVLNDTDTVLYGRSGIGKSSILNAGVLPSARRSGFVPILVRLEHKAEESYVSQIKNALLREGIIIENVSDNKCQEELLWELFHRNRFVTKSGERAKLLIIFDQFEEIFTLQDNTVIKRNFFDNIADVINDIMPNKISQESDEDNTLVEKDVKPVEMTSNDDFLFDDISLDLSAQVIDEFVNDNIIHLVFTLREDFLSEFEYYTANIPSLKNHRYNLRPINEEQAAEIIQKPLPGLVDTDVAKLIIQKVTGRTDFELDGMPEIDVDSAILSLYLNRLYEVMPDADTTFTDKLILQFGDNIINDFYQESIASLPEETVTFLEDTLLNSSNRRENISEESLLERCPSLTTDILNLLINVKRIIRRFSYNGTSRIEFVHDILCPVIAKHKNEREMRIKEEQN